jgi:hypothetical protein
MFRNELGDSSFASGDDVTKHFHPESVRDGTIIVSVSVIYTQPWGLLFMADYPYDNLEVRIQDENTFELLFVSIGFIDFSN